MLILVLVPSRSWATARAAEREAREEGAGPEPELILPGDHVVRAGEWIELRWTRADGISEMEILLSEDGGRHYSICISPELDPAACAFRWRVPEAEKATGGDLRMRIRFNRDGREIEGAPSEPLAVETGDRDRSRPLGLPPIEGSAAPREPRSSGERSETRVAPGWLGIREARSPGATAHPLRAWMPAISGAEPRPEIVPTPFAAPRSLPLRS